LYLENTGGKINMLTQACQKPNQKQRSGFARTKRDFGGDEKAGR